MCVGRRDGGEGLGFRFRASGSGQGQGHDQGHGQRQGKVRARVSCNSQAIVSFNLCYLFIVIMSVNPYIA